MFATMDTGMKIAILVTVVVLAALTAGVARWLGRR